MILRSHHDINDLYLGSSSGSASINRLEDPRTRAAQAMIPSHITRAYTDQCKCQYQDFKVHLNSTAPKEEGPGLEKGAKENLNALHAEGGCYDHLINNLSGVLKRSNESRTFDVHGSNLQRSMLDREIASNWKKKKKGFVMCQGVMLML